MRFVNRFKELGAFPVLSSFIVLSLLLNAVVILMLTMLFRNFPLETTTTIEGPVQLEPIEIKVKTENSDDQASDGSSSLYIPPRTRPNGNNGSQTDTSNPQSTKNGNSTTTTNGSGNGSQSGSQETTNSLQGSDNLQSNDDEGDTDTGIDGVPTLPQDPADLLLQCDRMQSWRGKRFVPSAGNSTLRVRSANRDWRINAVSPQKEQERLVNIEEE